MLNQLPASIDKLVHEVSTKLSSRPKTVQMFKNCMTNTFVTTMQELTDGSVFVVTGDIPAMWLRDSAAQVRPYLIAAREDPEVTRLIAGVIQKQVDYIIHDPYANAFNKEANGNGHQSDKTDMTDLVWERKYEIDSLCSPIQLAYLFWKATGIKDHFTMKFQEAVVKIIEVWETEQKHASQSNYSFHRFDCVETDTLVNEGKGSPVGYTGMTWSGFRPSDDACQYGYLIPSNMFAKVVLGYLSEIFETMDWDLQLKNRIHRLAEEIECGIMNFGIYDHEVYGKIYAYETDGLGNYNLMDDANVPSLLSLPYLGYCLPNDPIYINTRNFILSNENPYYYQGISAKGIGSPHTPKDYIWHIALAIEGLTALELPEMERILSLLESCDGDQLLMHEGFHKDNPREYTREWFSWANAMYCEFVLAYCGIYVPSSPLAIFKPR